MKNLYFPICLFLISCSKPTLQQPEISPIVFEENDSLESILDFLDQIEGTHAVEHVSEGIVVLKKQNNILKKNLKDVKQQLQTTQDSLEITKDRLDHVINDGSEFVFLPIKVPPTDNNR